MHHHTQGLGKSPSPFSLLQSPVFEGFSVIPCGRGVSDFSGFNEGVLARFVGADDQVDVESLAKQGVWPVAQPSSASFFHQAAD